MEFSNTTDFICQSQDLEVASNVPLDDLSQTCGRECPFYVYNGAFSNRSLTIVKNDSVMFKIDVRKIETSTTLFEFGLSHGSVSRRDLIGSPSREYLGWVLKRFDKSRQYSLMNTNRQIINSNMNIIFFVFKVELSRNRTAVLRVFNDSGKIFEYIDEQRLPFLSYKWLFFLKLAHSNEAKLKASIISKNLSFDRSTLYPGMFISENNKEISNHRSTALTEKHVEENSVYQDIVLHNCSQKCMYVLEFKIINPKPGRIFSLHLSNSRFLSMNRLYNLSIYSVLSMDPYVQAVFDTNLDAFPKDRYNQPIHVGEWETLIIVLDKKLKSISFQFSSVVFSTQNEHLMGRDDPVLRWAVHSLEAELIIKKGEKEKYSICFWILTHVSKSFVDSLEGKLSCVVMPNDIMIWISIIFFLILFVGVKGRLNRRE